MKENTSTSGTDAVEDDDASDVLMDMAMDAVMASPEFELMLDREYDRRFKLVEQAVEGEDSSDSICACVYDAIFQAAEDAVLATPEFDALLDRAIETRRRKAEDKKANTKDS